MRATGTSLSFQLGPVKDRPAETGSLTSNRFMMQADSGIYLGRIEGVEANRYDYWRQLRDMKGSALIEAITPPRTDAGTCGWALPRAHARFGNPIAIYLGDSDAFDQSITDLS